MMKKMKWEYLINMMKEFKKISQEVAEEFRKEANITGYVGFNVESILEALHYRVIRMACNDKELRGFALYNDGITGIVLNSNFNSRRQNFTLLHEVWHLFPYVREQYPAYLDGEDAERVADMFAASIYFPREKIISDIKKYKQMGISQIEIFYLIADVTGATYESVLREASEWRFDTTQIINELKEIKVSGSGDSFETENEQKLISLRNKSGIPNSPNDQVPISKNEFAKYDKLKRKYPEL